MSSNELPKKSIAIPIMKKFNIIVKITFYILNIFSMVYLCNSSCIGWMAVSTYTCVCACASLRACTCVWCWLCMSMLILHPTTVVHSHSFSSIPIQVMCIWMVESGGKMVWILWTPNLPPLDYTIMLLEAVLFFMGAFFTLAFCVFAFVAEQSRARRLLVSVSCMYSNKCIGVLCLCVCTCCVSVLHVCATMNASVSVHVFVCVCVCIILSAISLSSFLYGFHFKFCCSMLSSFS